MKIAVGSDKKFAVCDFVVKELKRRKHTVELLGALKNDKTTPWPKVGEEVAKMVSSKKCKQGILFCWTGTGVSIAANKVPGIRAALCFDAETASGARKWNNANILVMSLRLTSENIAKEILNVWFFSKPDKNKKDRLEMLEKIEKKYFKK